MKAKVSTQRVRGVGAIQCSCTVVLEVKCDLYKGSQQNYKQQLGTATTATGQPRPKEPWYQFWALASLSLSDCGISGGGGRGRRSHTFTPS